MGELGGFGGEPFSPDDFDRLSGVVIDAWISGLNRDWSVPAGTLEWSCLHTADHLVDCIFSYALFLGSRKQDGYPNFSELHAQPGATPHDLIDGLRAVTTMLWAVTVTAPPEARAVLRRFPLLETGTPSDFAARGGLEMMLHGQDVCRGLGVPLDPPRDVCERLLRHTEGWPGEVEIEATRDPWSDLVARSGRPRPA
jgi:uncharacterized protein (TIGR03083 family)